MKRRKATLDYLKDAASTSSQLDETQEFELMQQMKVSKINLVVSTCEIVAPFSNLWQRGKWTKR